MKKRIRNITAIAAAYTGTLFGAGFVSGQEILRFFSSWGTIGLIGPVIAGAGFAVLGIIVMLNARRLNTQEHEKIISPVSGIVPAIINILLCLWLFGIIITMLAAAGELFQSVTGLNHIWGSLIMTVIVIVLHTFGKTGFINVFSFVVPLMMLLGFGTAIVGIITGSDNIFSANAESVFTVAPHWAISAALYISYNILGNIGMLGRLGLDAGSDSEVKLGAIIGGGVPGLFALLICAALLSNHSIAFSSDMPMFAIASSINPILGILYAAILFIGIFTATCGISFSFFARIYAYRLPGILGNHIFTVIAVCVLAFIGSGLGFASLVGTVYPAYGWLGLIIIALMIINFFKTKNLKRSAN